MSYQTYFRGELRFTQELTATLVYFDLETTGLDPETDRIVELAFFGGDGGELTGLVNPCVPIPAEATETHGITDSDVADSPTFADVAKQVETMIEGAVLVGFNSLRFDVPFLDAELRRAGRSGLPRGEWGEILPRDIDLYRVWVERERRDLASAVQRFADVAELGEGAHRASKDASVLRDVMNGMLADFFPLAEVVEEGQSMRVAPGWPPVGELLRITAPPEMLDRAGKFKRRENGKIVFAFGQQADKPVATQPGYLKWMISKDFPEETKEIARRMLARLGRSEP